MGSIAVLFKQGGVLLAQVPERFIDTEIKKRDPAFGTISYVLRRYRPAAGATDISAGAPTMIRDKPAAKRRSAATENPLPAIS